MKHAPSKHISSPLFEQQRELIEELAKKHGILKRRRQIRSMSELLFALQLVALTKTPLRTVAELFSGLFRQIRDSSLFDRLCSLQPLLRELLLTLSENSLKMAQKSIFLFDGSIVNRLGEKSSTWRMHLLFHLDKMRFCSADLTTAKVPECSRRLPGHIEGLLIADRGYSKPRVMVDSNVGDFLFRFSPPHCNLYHTIDEQKVEFSQMLPQKDYIEGRCIEIENVYTTYQKKSRRLWVYALQVPINVYKQRKKQLQRRASKQQKKLSGETLELAKWTFLCSNLRWENPKEAFDLYRCRWQIELGIKRWKSILGVGEMNVQKLSVYGEVLLTTQILYALFVEKIVVGLAQRWSGPKDFPRHRTFQVEHKKFQGRLLRVLEDFRYRWRSGSSSLPEGKRKRKLCKPPCLSSLSMVQPEDLRDLPSFSESFHLEHHELMGCA